MKPMPSRSTSASSPLVSDAHVHHVEVGLDDRDFAGSQRLQGLIRPLGRHAPRPDLAAPNQARQRLAYGRRRDDVQRRIVELKQVEVVGAEPRQAALGRGDDRRRREVRRLIPGLVACLGGDDGAGAPAAHGLADQRLAMAVAVGDRRVEEGNAAFQRAVEGGERGAVVGIAIGGLLRRCARRCPRLRSRSRKPAGRSCRAAGTASLSSGRPARA